MKKIGLLLAVCFMLILTAQAQKKDREAHPSLLPDMPIFRPDGSADDMPNGNDDDDGAGFGIDQETGELYYYVDPKSGLYFNFREREILDFQTGEVYSFDKFRKLLPKKNTYSSPEKKSITL